MPIFLKDVTEEEREQVKQRLEHEKHLKELKDKIVSAFGVPPSQISIASAAVAALLATQPHIKVELNPPDLTPLDASLENINENLHRIYGREVMLTPNQMRGICNLKPIESVEPISKEEHKAKHSSDRLDGMRHSFMAIDEMHMLGKVKNAELKTEDNGVTAKISFDAGVLYTKDLNQMIADSVKETMIKRGVGNTCL